MATITRITQESDIMAWQYILKRRKLTPEEHERYYGKVNRSGASEEAKRKREAILNDPKIKERARINKLKEMAEKRILALEGANKNIDEELNFFINEMNYPPKPQEPNALSEWVIDRSYNKSTISELIYEKEKFKAYTDFLKGAIKSNFKGIKLRTNNPKAVFAIRSEEDENEGDASGKDFGDYENKASAAYDKAMRKLGWD